MTPTEWKALTKPRPCDSCDGEGVTRDYDEDRNCEVAVRCELCLGCRELWVCPECLDAAPAIELEMWGGRCRLCVADRETRSIEDEADSMRRTA